MAQPARRTIDPVKPRIPALLMRVWDLPTRLFHWAIVVLLVVSYTTQALDWMDWHYWSGYTLLTLLLFRIVWGVIGSETSRFGQFLRNPAEAFAQLSSFSQRAPDREIGHNAAGGWMVLVMLAALLVQACTGLFAGDPVDGGGPFVEQISDAGRKWINRIHEANFNIILGLIILHVAAIVAYAIVKRHDLVRPMVTGKKHLPATMRQPRFASPALAGVVLVASGVVVWLVVSFG